MHVPYLLRRPITVKPVMEAASEPLVLASMWTYGMTFVMTIWVTISTFNFFITKSVIRSLYLSNTDSSLRVYEDHSFLEVLQVGKNRCIQIVITGRVSFPTMAHVSFWSHAQVAFSLSIKHYRIYICPCKFQSLLPFTCYYIYHPSSANTLQLRIMCALIDLPFVLPTNPPFTQIDTCLEHNKK